MATLSPTVPKAAATVKIPVYDVRQAMSKNRLAGLWRLMTGFHAIYVIAALGQGMAALSRTGTYLLLRYFVDQVLGPGQFNAPILLRMAAGFVLLALTEGSFTFLSGRLAAKTAESVAMRLRNYLFDHIQRLTFAYHDKTQTGDLIQRSTSDVDAVRRFFGDQAIGMGRIFMMFTVNFIALLDLKWELALLSVVVMPVIIIASVFFFKRINNAYEKFQEQEAVLSTVLQENLTGVRVVKAFARQEYERNKFEKENSKKYGLGRKLVLWNGAFWPSTDILCVAQLLTGIGIAAGMAINGSISLGTYLAYIGMLGWLIWPLRNLGRLIVQTSTGLVSYHRVMEIVKEEREPLETGDALTVNCENQGTLCGALEFTDVSFAYDGGAEALADISFRVEPGQAIALLGSTGSGKTSLVNLLPRFYDYTGGSITLDGVELKRYPRRFLRSQIGIVEQEPFLFSRSIRENISYGVGREVSMEDVESAARAAAIHDVIMTFPEGYNTLIGEKGVTLSGGQKQRVAIARTLLKNPRILILDDSTSSVDTETEAEIREALEGLMQGRTTFIIAHRIQSVMNADLILVMDKGRIVQCGKHAELVEQEGRYRQVYDIQMRIETELEKELNQ